MTKGRRTAKTPAPPVLSPTDIAAMKSHIIYEDPALLVFNKPSDLPVQGGSGIGRDLDHLLWAFATTKGRKPKLVHRLDRETSGVLVVAKTKPAAAHLSAQFEKRLTQKTYWALVSGVPATPSGVIETPLVRIQSGGLDVMRPALGGELQALAATTAWCCLSHSDTYAWIEAKPLSGRMHQIRVHLGDLGHPILGDTKYGGRLAAGAYPIPRLMLHAQTLTFTHPTTNQSITLTAPAPADFTSTLTELGLVSS